MYTWKATGFQTEGKSKITRHYFRNLVQRNLTCVYEDAFIQTCNGLLL